MERMVYAGAIGLAIVITLVLQNLWGEQVMRFLSDHLGPFILNTIGSTGALIIVGVVVLYGLARNKGRLLKELIEEEK